jgi:hypothetical protein
LLDLINIGLNQTDIIKYAKIIRKLCKSSYSIKDVALVMIMLVDEMAISRTRTTIIVDETIEILERAKEKLSR